MAGLRLHFTILMKRIIKSLNIYVHIFKNWSSDTYLTPLLEGLKEKVCEKGLGSD